MLLDIESFCRDTAPIWQFIGYILFVFKIAIPILLILFGMIDLGKAVIASDEKAIKNATSSLIKRAIAAVIVFFVPYLVSAIFGIVGSFSEIENVYKECQACVVHPTQSKCKGYVAATGGKVGE